MIYNTYDRLMMQSEEVMRRTIVDSDDETFDDDNPLFGRINGDPICGIALHVTSTNERRKNRDGKKLNTCFKASARYSVIRQHMCVRIVRTPMWSKMKCGSATLRQTVPILHRMCIAHTTFSDKYIIIKFTFLFILCHKCIIIVDTILMLCCVAHSTFST